MAPLVSVGDLASFLDDPAVAGARADLLVDLASGLVRGYCGWSISAETNAVATLDGTGTGILLLPTLRLTAVHSLEENGVALDPASYRWTEAGQVLGANGGYWPRYPRGYRVTFDHGFAVVPDAVRAVTLRVAARAWTNPEGLTQEGMGGYSAGFGFDATRFGALAPIDERELAPWRL